MEKYSEDRILGSRQVYSVFREAVVREDGVYSKQLHDEGFVGSREDANRLLSSLNELGVLQKGKRTRAQYYEPDWEGVSEYVSELLETDGSLPESFIESYVSGYVEVNEESSMEDMLVEQLITSIRTFGRKKDGMPEFLSSFLSEVKNPDVFDSRPDDLVEYAVRSSDSGLAERSDFRDWLDESD